MEDGNTRSDNMWVKSIININTGLFVKGIECCKFLQKTLADSLLHKDPGLKSLFRIKEILSIFIVNQCFENLASTCYKTGPQNFGKKLPKIPRVTS